MAPLNLNDFSNVILNFKKELLLFQYVFGSFISRDSTYKKLNTLWKLNQDSVSIEDSLDFHFINSITDICVAVWEKRGFDAN